MSGQKWTKEPWSWWSGCCREGGMITQDARASHVAAPTFYPNNAELTQANADRIVACVNGCAGLNPEAFAECVKQLEYMTARCEEENMEDSITDLICAKAAIANARKVSA